MNRGKLLSSLVIELLLEFLMMEEVYREYFKFDTTTRGYLSS